MEFTKMHGVGNDFVVIDTRSNQSKDWPNLARRMCDRHFGIGSDGIILVLPSMTADVRMMMFNPDGSEAEMCGNGIRCLAKYVYENELVSHKEMAIETAAGIKHTTLDVENGMVHRVTVSMGAPRLQPAEIPVLAQRSPVIDFPLVIKDTPLAVTCVSMGNPHAVAFLNDDPDSFPIETIGPLVENHPVFPRRVNFEVVGQMGHNHLKMRVWERGAGITLACGTGACATAVASRLKGLIGDRCRIDLPGGSLEIAWPGQGEVLLTGPVETVFTGNWS